MTKTYAQLKAEIAELETKAALVRAKEIDVAARLIARTDDVEMLAAGVREGLAILEGWRYEQFGRDALDLVEGRLAFTVYEGRLLMTRSEIA